MSSVAQTVALAAKEEDREQSIVRFDIHQRLQHLLMMGSFLVLAFTGLPQKFAGWSVSQGWIAFWGGMDRVRDVHHIAAYVMVFACIYHMLYLLYTTLLLKRPLPVWMIPSLKDVQDFLQDIRYFLGMADQEPKFDRFNYREKFDYWAIFWGMPIIGISGFVLMFPVFVSKFLPGQAVPIALVAHSDEAVLAVAWIFIVHFYFGHLSPKVFPINTSIFTGKIPRHRYADEHPLEYQRMMSDPDGKRITETEPAKVPAGPVPLVAPGADIEPQPPERAPRREPRGPEGEISGRGRGE